MREICLERSPYCFWNTRVWHQPQTVVYLWEMKTATPMKLNTLFTQLLYEIVSFVVYACYGLPRYLFCKRRKTNRNRPKLQHCMHYVLVNKKYVALQKRLRLYWVIVRSGSPLILSKDSLKRWHRYYNYTGATGAWQSFGEVKIHTTLQHHLFVLDDNVTLRTQTIGIEVWGLGHCDQCYFMRCHTTLTRSNAQRFPISMNILCACSAPRTSQNTFSVKG